MAFVLSEGGTSLTRVSSHHMEHRKILNLFYDSLVAYLRFMLRFTIIFYHFVFAGDNSEIEIEKRSVI